MAWQNKTFSLLGMNYVRTLLGTGIKSNTFCFLVHKELDLWPQINQCLFVDCWVQGDICPEFVDIPSKHSWNIPLKSRKWMNGGIIIWSFCHLLSSSSLKTPILHFLSVKTTLPNLPPHYFVKILRLPLVSLSFFFYLRETLHAVPEPLFLHFFSFASSIHSRSL